MARKKKKKITPFIRVLYAFIGVVFVAGAITAYTFYRKVFAPNTVLKHHAVEFIYIPTGSTFVDVLRILQKEDLLRNSESFTWVAEQMDYKKNVKPGKYQVKSRMSNKDLISLLRSGKQTPVKVTFNNVRTVEQLAGTVSKRIEADSNSIVNFFRDEYIQKTYSFTPQNSMSVLIPNTYEMYWNTSAKEFFERMAKEYKKFWTDTRKQKAKDIKLSQTEVSTLASIVEQETRKNDEKNMVAGVYMNRYTKGWRLEADPTLVYALGDFTVRRVLSAYKEIDSPYNTYMYTGLPPGPICIPSISSIDAVLNYSKHNYMFFCAKDDFSGYHSFAKTYNDHLLNARRFQKALNRRGIMG